VILLHGFTGSSASWGDRLIDGLTSAGVQPVLVDLPGHGRHAGEIDAAAFTLDAALGAITEASVADPAPVLGYSMGGRLALAYAVRYPERVSHLILESASPGLETESSRADRRASDEALAVRLETEGIETFVDLWETQSLFGSQSVLPEEVRATLRARRLLNDPESLAAALRGLGTGAIPSYWTDLERLSMPTLILVGELDPKFLAIGQTMAGQIPDARVAAVSGAGHAVHLERPDAWLEAVLGLLF
jgi:2-succinyl-6-hydroxy-2,4-cyclohexadiene-1-carboxylate synthase